MRTAYKVWCGIAATVFCVVAGTDLSRSSETPSSAPSTPIAASSTATLASSAPTAAAPVAPSTGAAAQKGELVSVTKVVDGATIEVTGRRTVRLLGLSACKVSTKGGREAKEHLEMYASVGQQVRLIADGTRDSDAMGRLLRRVERDSRYGSSSDPYFDDIGTSVVASAAIGVDDQAGADAAYVTELREHDFGQRDCSGTPDTGFSGGVDVGDHGHVNLPDGALTGGYCARKWWC